MGKFCKLILNEDTDITIDYFNQLLSSPNSESESGEENYLLVSLPEGKWCSIYPGIAFDIIHFNHDSNKPGYIMPRRTGQCDLYSEQGETVIKITRYANDNCSYGISRTLFIPVTYGPFEILTSENYYVNIILYFNQEMNFNALNPGVCEFSSLEIRKYKFTHFYHDFRKNFYDLSNIRQHWEYALSDLFSINDGWLYPAPKLGKNFIDVDLSVYLPNAETKINSIIFRTNLDSKRIGTLLKLSNDSIIEYENHHPDKDVMAFVIPGHSFTIIPKSPSGNFYAHYFSAQILMKKLDVYSVLIRPDPSEAIRYLHQGGKSIEIFNATIDKINEEHRQDKDKPSIHTPDSGGNLAIHWIAYYGYCNLLDAILNHNYISKKNYLGQMPIHKAAENGQCLMIANILNTFHSKEMLSWKAQFHNLNLTPLEIAEQMGHHDAAKLLQAYFYYNQIKELDWEDKFTEKHVTLKLTLEILGEIKNVNHLDELFIYSCLNELSQGHCSIDKNFITSSLSLLNNEIVRSRTAEKLYYGGVRFNLGRADKINGLMTIHGVNSRLGFQLTNIELYIWYLQGIQLIKAKKLHPCTFNMVASFLAPIRPNEMTSFIFSLQKQHAFQTFNHIYHKSGFFKSCCKNKKAFAIAENCLEQNTKSVLVELLSDESDILSKNCNKKLLKVSQSLHARMTLI